MAHIPDEISRAKVAALASYGLPHKLIAKEVGISDNTLRAHYPEELRDGKSKANAQVAKTLFHLAVVKQNPICCMFWLKCQAGWSETHRLELPNTNGMPSLGYDLSVLSIEERKRLDELLSKTESAPRAEPT